MNPAYGDLKRIMEELNAEPKPVPPPQEEAEDVRERLNTAMDVFMRMKLDYRCLPALYRKTLMALSLCSLALDKEHESLSTGFASICRGLSEYGQKVR